MKALNERVKKLGLNSELIQRFGIVISSSLLVLLTAASCSVPGFNNSTPTTLGVLKRDPSVLQNGFGKVNNVETIDGQTVNNGLGTLSGLKLAQVDPNILTFLSKDKGLFVTTNAGRAWQRKYIFPVSNPKDVDKKTFDAQIAANDALLTSDFSIDANDSQTIYLSGKINKLGKIYLTSDRGGTFREIYSEVESDVGVLFVEVDPNKSSNVYALLEGGALIASRDGGRTWQKLRSFKDTPVQMGFVKEFSNLFYVLFQQDGLFTSSDNGVTWTPQPTTKSPSEIGEQQPKDGLDVPFIGTKTFGKYEKIMPITATSNGGWLLIADRQLWYSTSLTSTYSKLVLPLQSEQFNLLDIEPDPTKGLDKLYVSIDNKLFLTENRGVSWTTGDLIGISTPTGQIGEIIVDKTKPEIIYLMLVQSGTKRGSIFGN